MPDSDAHTHPFGGEALREPSAEEPRAAEHGDRGHGVARGILDQIDSFSNKRSRRHAARARTERPAIWQHADPHVTLSGSAASSGL
jgi:hypothetical protein